MTSSANIVLQTKLRCPPLAAGLLNRSRLLARLDAGADCTLTLVVAPAGSGKTSLVRQWLEQQTTPVAWLQLDANDSDPSLFFTYVVHALRQISPQFGAETEILLQSPRLPPLSVLVHTLSNEIDQLDLPYPWLLVLDDYHLVQNPEIEAALADLVLRPPADFRLLVISRQAPAWPLGRLRVENRLLTVDADDLRFTAEETAAYIQLNAVAPADAELAARLQRQTEGWAAGLQLALLALRRTPDEQVLFGPRPGAFGSNVPGSRYLLDYMVDEVLAKLSPDLLAFMYATSLCTRFTAALCQAMTGMERERVRGYLHLLETANLFLIPLGSLEDHHTWYRYHHLMGQTLDSRRQEVMAPEALAELHRRAAAWLGEHGHVEEALDHFIAAEDWEAATQLAVGQSSLLFDREDRRTIERWLSRFPVAEVAARPRLLLMQTWSCFFNLDIPGLAQTLAETRRTAAAAMIKGEPAQIGNRQDFEGQCLLLQGVVAYFMGDVEAALDATQRALPLLARSSAFFYASTYFYLGSVMQFAGRGEEAEELLLAAYRRQPKPSQPSARILFSAGTVRLFDGRLSAAYESAELLLQESRAAHLILLEGWAHDTLGRIDLEHNRLDAAEAHFAVLRERAYALHRGCAYDGFTGSMLVAAAHGRSDIVAQIAEEWRSFEQSLWGLPGPLHHSAQARAALLLGDFTAAGRWAAKFNTPLGPPMVWLETSHITKLRCLLASGAARDLEAADELSLACLAHAERMHNFSAQLALLGLRSLVLDGRGQRKAAVDLLRQALRLGAPEGFVRTFVELGPGLLNLLAAVDDPELAEYIAGLRAAFAPAPPRSAAQLQDTPAAALTQRELEVLALLATPLSLQEIGDKLFISYSTVRQHTAHIYEKLDVGKRRHAVLAASELGLLASAMRKNGGA